MSLAGTVLDTPRLLRPVAGYTSDPRYAMRSADDLEPEAISKDDEQVFADQSNTAREILMADELARKRTRSRASRLTQLEIQARERSRDASSFTDRIDRTLDEFQRWIGA